MWEHELHPGRNVRLHATSEQSRHRGCNSGTNRTGLATVQGYTCHREPRLCGVNINIIKSIHSVPPTSHLPPRHSTKPCDDAQSTVYVHPAFANERPSESQRLAMVRDENLRHSLSVFCLPLDNWGSDVGLFVKTDRRIVYYCSSRGKSTCKP